MKKQILFVAFAISVCISMACTTSNDNSNQDYNSESEDVWVDETQQSINSWAGTYTFKGTDGKTYKLVLKPRSNDYADGKVVVYVNGKETDYGTWYPYTTTDNYCRVTIDDINIPVPGQNSWSSTIELKGGFAYAYNAAASENPKKRVKYTKTK